MLDIGFCQIMKNDFFCASSHFENGKFVHRDSAADDASPVKGSVGEML